MKSNSRFWWRSTRYWLFSGIRSNNGQVRTDPLLHICLNLFAHTLLLCHLQSPSVLLNGSAACVVFVSFCNCICVCVWVSLFSVCLCYVLWVVCMVTCVVAYAKETTFLWFWIWFHKSTEGRCVWFWKKFNRSWKEWNR